jgi:NAD(P)-dependent dehydrogenase (short-subunit alcohol dehydrogenase family)
MNALAPRVLVVTGAGRGIGAATARRAARAGWDVVVNARRDAAAAEAVAADVRAAGRRALVVMADTATEAGVMALFQATDRAFGALHGLVNNAGVVDVAQRVEQMSEARLQRMFTTNVVGPFLCAREAVRRMSTRHGGAGGAIVNVGSAASRLGSPNQYVDYAASKAAIDTFTKGLALEVATEGIRVNAVRPGIIDTGIHASGGQPDRARELAPSVPMQRAGSADEVAAAIVWLLGDDAAYVTGAIVDVSGGR